MNLTNSLKMFHWQGINEQGFKVQGKYMAKNIAEVTVFLFKQHVTPLAVRKKRLETLFLSTQKISAEEITNFAREIVTLIRAGIPLFNALELIKQNTTKPILHYLITSIHKQIESGNTLYEALRLHPQYFNTLFFSLVHAGEQSGTLETMLQQIVLYREKTTRLKKRIQKALYYPAVIFSLSLLISFAMLLFVVPQFERLFISLGAQLPVFTQCIIQSAGFVRTYGCYLSITLFICIIGIKTRFKHSPTLKKFADIYSLKTVFIGQFIRQAIFARSFRTLAITLQAGLPLLQGLQLTAKSAENYVYEQRFESIAREIESGHSLHIAFSHTEDFPQRVVQMIRIGETSGKLEESLNKLSDYFEEKIDRQIEILTQLLEPVIMGILSIWIGGLIIALYLPIFHLGSVV